MRPMDTKEYLAIKEAIQQGETNADATLSSTPNIVSKILSGGKQWLTSLFSRRTEAVLDGIFSASTQIVE